MLCVMASEASVSGPVLEGPTATRALIERLERARPDEPARLVFDADGTLWSGDVGFDLFAYALEHRVLRPAVTHALQREMEALGLVTKGDAEPHRLAAELLAAHHRGQYADLPAYAMMAWAFAGFSQAEMMDLAETVVERSSVRDRVFGFVAPVLEWARAADVEVVVCSASPRAIVVAGARCLGLEDGHVIAFQPAIEDGLLLTRLADGPAPFALGKVERLALDRGPRALLAGFGDSAGDAHFLRLAAVPVAVRPQPGLVALAPSIPGLVTLLP